MSIAEVNDEQFWAELPSALRTDMALEMARPLFQHSDIFKTLDPPAERLVAARLQPVVIPAGHNVAQEGDDADALYLMQEGAHPLPLLCIFLPTSMFCSLSLAKIIGKISGTLICIKEGCPPGKQVAHSEPGCPERCFSCAAGKLLIVTAPAIAGESALLIQI
jgi:hypothetical protein